MKRSWKGFFVGVAMMVGGVVAFFIILALLGIDPDEQPIGLMGWVLGGVLIGPGFGYLLKWRQAQDKLRAAQTPGDRA